MVTLALRSFPRVSCSLDTLAHCLSHLIGLLLLIHFTNLILIKLNVRALSALHR